MYIDSYLIPLKSTTEVIKDKKYFYNKGRNSSVTTYYVETSTRKVDVTASFYNSTSIGDTVNLLSSPITRSIQKVIIKQGSYLYRFEIGYIRASFGIIYVPIVLLVLILFHIFYYSIKYLPGRRNLMIASLIATLIAFFFHLGLTFN